jgi:hypothetical protein
MAAGAGTGVGFALFLVALGAVLLCVPGFLRRLKARAAMWRPVPFISLLERPG